MTNALVWFRHDLRLGDNPTLVYALEHQLNVHAVFIHDASGPWAMGAAQRWWYHESLLALRDALREQDIDLAFFAGAPQKILERLVTEQDFSYVLWNRCYEPAAIRRDTEIKRVLTEHGCRVKSFNGTLINEPWTIENKSGGPYKVFTPYWKHVRDNHPPQPPEDYDPARLRPAQVTVAHDGIASLGLCPEKDWYKSIKACWSPGEANAHKRLRNFLNKALSCYQQGRDLPARDGTSRLSPHLHAGEISPARVWIDVERHVATCAEKVDSDSVSTFLSELVWREFSYHLLYHFPHLPDSAFREEFNDYPWHTGSKALKRWQKGQTGIPIVDAGMRQLWQEGWMHNRVRMIVASLLTKNLGLHWKSGEAWFWDCLVDADLASNAAGWQWVAGSGADAQPFFRIFNPITQGEKFDPQGAYVKTYVPELKNLPEKYIHCPWTAPAGCLKDAGVVLDDTYPAPIVDLKKSRQEALAAYKALRS